MAHFSLTGFSDLLHKIFAAEQAVIPIFAMNPATNEVASITLIGTSLLTEAVDAIHAVNAQKAAAEPAPTLPPDLGQAMSRVKQAMSMPGLGQPTTIPGTV